MGKIFFYGGIALLAIFAITIFGGSFYTIDSGERGVLLRYGKVVGTAEPGLGFKLPLIDSVEKLSVQSHSQLYEKLATYSRDQQPTDIKLSVNWHIPGDQVDEVYTAFGGAEGLISRILDRRVTEQTKNVFGQYNAVNAIQSRAKLNLEIENAIKAAVHGPIVIESVQIENIDFSESYEQSIEARMLAEVEVQKLQQNAEREKVQAQITVTQANAKADAVRAAAEAEAAAIRVKGNAEADAIKVKSAALDASPNLIALTTAEKWDGKLPTTMVPGATVPFLNVAK